MKQIFIWVLCVATLPCQKNICSAPVFPLGNQYMQDVLQGGKNNSSAEPQ